MIYLKKFDSHASYETEINGGGGVDISLPNVSYCKDVKDIHYTPYNLVRFYVGKITGTTPQTVKIYTDSNTSVDVQVSEGNKWYSYVLPKYKGLYKIYGDSVKKVVVKANITTNEEEEQIIPNSTVEASFKGSDTSNVTNMNYMFGTCSGLTSLDVSNFDTSNVTNIGYMFYDCSSLTSLDVSHFNTSNVTLMEQMFSGCRGLASLDLSSFDTSKVTDMNSMFQDCTSLTSLDLRNFNTSKVTDMNYMFKGCNGLTSLDLSHFNTSNVNDMSYMFYNCSSLTSLTLSGWVISDATNTSYMFRDCTSLTSIRMAGCNQTTINKIKAVMPSSASISTV